jgi:DNA polymerase-3 subunit gamma/tau
MRDSQSAFDQVMAFAGTTVTAEDVASVLGLVRRDLLIEMASAVAADNASALFELAGRAVESGYDLRVVVRELARLTRDLLVISIDPSRVSDPEIAADAERQALLDLSRRFSGEDLMRAFDVLSKAEYDIKGSMQPRYHLEMALLRWVHLRKLTPLADLIKQMEGGPPARPSMPAPPPARTAVPAPTGQTVRAVENRRSSAASQPAAASESAAAPIPPKLASASEGGRPGAPLDPAQLKEAFLEEIRKQKKFFYGTVVAQAQRIDLQPGTITFVFGPQHRALRSQLEQTRAWLESTASQLAGRKMAIAAADGAGSTGPGAAPKTADAAVGGDRTQELKERALADNGVQAMLDVFAAEIKDIEEM